MMASSAKEKTLDPLRRHNSARMIFEKYADSVSQQIKLEMFDKVCESIVQSVSEDSQDKDPNQVPVLSPTCQSHVLGFCFEDFDKNGDRAISWPEFVELHNAVLAFQLSSLKSLSFVSLASSSGEDQNRRKLKKMHGFVLGDVGFSASYKFARGSSTYDTVNLSNNIIGQGIVAWVRRFDNQNTMRNLIVQNCRLKDSDILKLISHLSDHPNVKRIDVRGNSIRKASTYKALHTLADRNVRICEILLDDTHLTGVSFGAVKAMQKSLASNRRRSHTNSRNIRDSLEQKNKNANPGRSMLFKITDKSAKTFADLTRTRWTATGFMNGLIAAKRAIKRDWPAQVCTGKKMRAQARSYMEQISKENGIQLEAHRPRSMKDLRSQGNVEMYTDEALRQRSSLRSHPEIMSCIHRWWYCLLIPTFDKNLNGVLEKNEYIVFHKCLNMALQASIESHSKAISPQKATQMALEDWEADSNGFGHVDLEMFENALFELVDLWTDTTDVQEYLDFLDFLFSSMSIAMKKFPYLNDQQRQNIQFQVRQQRFLIDAKRCKAARLDSLGISHALNDELLTKLHRDFEEAVVEESLCGFPRSSNRGSVVSGKFTFKRKPSRGTLYDLPCSRRAFEKVLSMQGFALDTTTKRLFDIFDTDGNGYVDWSELLIGLSTIVRHSDTKTIAKRTFDLFDRDNTGILDIDRFKSMIKASCRLHGVVLQDEDIQERLNKIFPNASDCKQVSLQDFIEAVHRYPDILPLIDNGTQINK